MINNVTKNPKNNKLEINSIETWLSSFHKNLKKKQGCNLVPKLAIHFNENFDQHILYCIYSFPENPMFPTMQIYRKKFLSIYYIHISLCISTLCCWYKDIFKQSQTFYLRILQPHL